MIKSQKKIVVITPVYEDLEASSRLFKELAFEFNEDVFIVAVDDGSVNQPLTISCIENASIDGLIIKLKRNVGHQRAIAIGLSYVSENMADSQYVIVMDSDGEDVPSTICHLLMKLNTDNIDLAVAQRKSRIETIRFKFFYAIYKLLFQLMTGRVISFGNFMALKPYAVKRLVAMQELSLHLAGAVLASKLRAGICPLDRGARYAGQSKANFIFQALHGFKALMVFAEDVLVRVGVACAIIAAFSLLGAILAIILKLIGVATPGWFSVALGILILMLIQTGGLALMTLMLTGVIRSGNAYTVNAYQDFVDKIIVASAHASNSNR